MIVEDEDIMDISELNKHKIEENRWHIVQNRMMILTFFVLFLVLNIGGVVLLKHDIVDCQDRLYEKVTGQKIERDMFVSTDDKSPIR